MKKQYLFALSIVSSFSFLIVACKDHDAGRDKLAERIEGIVHNSKYHVSDSSKLIAGVTALMTDTGSIYHSPFAPGDTNIAKMITHFQSDVVGSNYNNPTKLNSSDFTVNSNSSYVFQLSLSDLNTLVRLVANAPDKNIYFKFAAFKNTPSTCNPDPINDYVNNHPGITAATIENHITMVCFNLTAPGGTVANYYNYGTICPPPSGGICAGCQ